MNAIKKITYLCGVCGRELFQGFSGSGEDCVNTLQCVQPQCSEYKKKYKEPVETVKLDPA